MIPTPFAGQQEGLTVVGEATRHAPPELVDVTFDVHSAAPGAAQALRENALKLMQIGQAVTAMGVAQNEIETSPGTVYPLYQPSHPFAGFPQLPGAGLNPFVPAAQPNVPPELSPVAGYHVVSYLKLSVRDLSRLGEIVDTAIRAGANISAGFLFRLRDEPAVRRTLLEAAGREARSKAETLANALGRHLGDVAAATEDFSAYYLGMGNGHFRPAAPLNVGPRVSPGELTFHARVNVTYRWQ